MIPWLLATVALGGEAPVEASLHADAKSFFVSVLPYEDELLFPEGATGQGIVDGRAKLRVDLGDSLRIDAHHAVSALSGSSSVGAGFGTGVALSAPEAVQLSWRALEEDSLQLRGRTDRLALRGSLPGAELTLGRQPISFGAGMFFTPMDLVSPFTPAVIDTEYKPGVDAIRSDLYLGMSGRLTAVAAYAGAWDLEGLALALHGQTTVGVSDLSVFLGEIHADEVMGLGVVTSVGAIGLHSDATLTLPEAEDEEPFVRAVGGASWRPGQRTTLSGELYLQTLGSTNSQDYAALLASERVARGEIWLVGIGYGALALSQEFGPLLSGTLSTVANLGDPSMLLSAGLSISASNDVVIAFGGMYGLGPRPGELDPLTLELPIPSEFGLYPAVAWLQTRAYF